MPAPSFEARVAILKRKLEGASREVLSIVNSGRQALKDISVVPRFKAMFNCLEKYYQRYETCFDELAELHILENKEGFPSKEDQTLFDNTRRYYYEAHTLHEGFKTPVGTDSPHAAETTIKVDNVLPPSAHLPKITIPKFEGEFSQWPRFRDSFQSIVHEDDSIPVITKFHYLVTSLGKSAASVISHLPLIADNYLIAWESLLSTYDNRRILAATYLNAILSIPPITGSPTNKQLLDFLTRITENVSAFRLLQIPNEADFLLYFLAFRTLDKTTREQFELKHRDIPFPSFNNLSGFIRERCLALQLADFTSLRIDSSSQSPMPIGTPSRAPFKAQSKTSLFVKSKPTGNVSKLCYICSKTHKLIECPIFNSYDSRQRRKLLKGYAGCLNCLSAYHFTKNCSSTRRCRICAGAHHSMLHTNSYNDTNTQDNAEINTQGPASHAQGGPATLNKQGSSKLNAPPEKRHSSHVSLSSISPQTRGVLLGTALVNLRDSNNSSYIVRAVLDSGSQHTFITSRVASHLKQAIRKTKLKLSGIGKTPFSDLRGTTSCTITPINQEQPRFLTDALIVDTITSSQPNFSIPSNWVQPYLSYSLADPSFWQPKDIDILIGADLFAQVILPGETLKIRNDGPILLSSVFGYVVMGNVPFLKPANSNCLLVGSEPNTDGLRDDLRKFWEIEESVIPSSDTSEEERLAEDHFISTYTRTNTGRYVVRLPFRSSIPSFNDTQAISMKRFLNTERKLQRDQNLRDQYVAFIDEYAHLSHMSATTKHSKFMLPHHAVMKCGKIRVVFDASVSTRNGSLNDHLMVGPKLQKDIRHIVLNFRKHQIVFTADIIKMYRQIELDLRDRSYQHIFWRSNPKHAVQKFELNTLTYGMNCAPYLAQRVISQLCNDEGHNFPLAVAALKQDMYIDDLATGTTSVEAALELQQQIVGLLAKGGFTLSKWSSNNRNLVPGVQECLSKPININDPNDCTTVKILGLQWNPHEDTFSYTIANPGVPDTKRGLLSAVARIFDPLGWLAPTVLLAKTLIQDLWKCKSGWDDPIPSETQNTWHTFVQELQELSQIHLPRQVLTNINDKIQIIGFSDASIKAYSATIYIKDYGHNNEISLLTARTRLAPVKTITIPRLELCGALLLARAYASLKPFLEGLTIIDPVFFTDSQIVLAWLKTEPYKLKTFVANRVTEILSVTSTSQWNHVRSKDNPSDVSSRGLLPKQLVACDLWWKGPSWILEESSEWPTTTNTCKEVPELKSTSETTSMHSSTQCNPLVTWMEKYSNFVRMIRVLSWVNRFIHNAKRTDVRRRGPLNLKELQHANYVCIKAVQSFYFFKDAPVNPTNIPKTFENLHPCLDDVGVVRVGGRLTHSNLPEMSKHPILLPSDCHFTRILVDNYHISYLHPGPNLLQALIQRRYWIPSLRRITRRRTFLCLKCYKSKAASKQITPLMADLPPARVQGIRAFLRTGVDFAGPFRLRHSLLRKSVVSKSYMCLFICMATKAVHIEAVTDLSTNAFLACLDRFVARRGYPEEIFSDCGTNFLGAANNIRDLREWLRDEATQDDLVKNAASSGFTWTFNVPYGPHRGGLWEAAVKSDKSIITKVAGDTPLTLEEWFTLYSKVEAILNSRPLGQLPSVPEETNYLTPGHFLIGTHLTVPPEPSLEHLQLNRLSRLQLIQKMSRDFWKRWSLEYLTTLQKRHKWTEEQPNVKIGDIVLLRESNSSPLHWPMARITEVIPGKDGVVRVVRLQTGSSELMRPVQKLVRLQPLDTPPFED